MASYNNITLLGNVGNVQVKTFSNGGKVVEVTLATTERYKDRDNNQREDTQWHNLVIGGNLADVAEKYVTKGSPLFVTGKMTYRKYQNAAGENRYAPEVRVNALQLLNSREKSGDAPAPAAAPAAAAPAPADNPHLQDLQAPEGDGDLPF